MTITVGDDVFLFWGFFFLESSEVGLRGGGRDFNFFLPLGFFRAYHLCFIWFEGAGVRAGGRGRGAGVKGVGGVGVGWRDFKYRPTTDFFELKAGNLLAFVFCLYFKFLLPLGF